MNVLLQWPFSRHKSATDHEWRAWMVGWLGGPVLGIANGAARERLYKDRVGNLTAHQISTLTLITLLAWYIAMLDRRWPIRSTRSAFEIGAAWASLTILFEFGFGHYIARASWSDLLDQYDVSRGRVWPLVLVWTAIGPAVVRVLRGG
jgi:hypothetical protein